MTSTSNTNCTPFDRVERIIDRSESYLKFAATFSEIHYETPMSDAARTKALESIRKTIDALKRTLDAAWSSALLLDSIEDSAKSGMNKAPLPMWKVKRR